MRSRWTMKPGTARIASRSPSERRSDGGSPTLHRKENPMRTVSSILLPAALVAATFAATPASAETKIAVVRTQAILRDAPQTKSASQKMKTEFEKREKDLNDEGKKLQDDIEKFQREADTMSASQRATTDKDLNSRKQSF